MGTTRAKHVKREIRAHEGARRREKPSIGPLQLAIHVVQNRHAGEQKSYNRRAFCMRMRASAERQ